jgi:hypothetical protein
LGHGGVSGCSSGSDDDLRQCRTFTDRALAFGSACTGTSANAGAYAHACANPDADADTDTNSGTDSAVAVNRRGTAGDDLPEPGTLEQQPDPKLLSGQYMDIYPDPGQRGVV